MSQLIALALGLALMSAVGAASGTAAPEDYPMQAVRVTDRVYAILTPTRELPNPENRGWNSNSAFVVTDEGVLLFDTGSSTTIGRALRQAIAGVTDQPVRWIINSHAHGDHWLGNAAFSDTVQAIYASTAVADRVRSDGKDWVANFARMTGGATGDSTVMPPDHPVDARTELRLGGSRFVLFPSNDSHSPGDLVLWLPEQRILIPGDVVYSDRMPSTNHARLDNWIAMLDEFLALEPVAVIPGHGGLTDGTGVERLRDLLQTLRTAVLRGIEEGLSDYEMLRHVNAALAPFKRHYPGLEGKLRRDISHVYLQLEAAVF